MQAGGRGEKETGVDDEYLMLYGADVKPKTDRTRTASVDTNGGPVVTCTTS